MKRSGERGAKLEIAMGSGELLGSREVDSEAQQQVGFAVPPVRQFDLSSRSKTQVSESDGMSSQTRKHFA